MKSIKIGLLGFGTVGSGTFKIITDNSKSIAQKVGAEIKIAGILVRNMGKARNAGANRSLFTTRPEDIIDNDEIDILVEVMGGIDPAREYILRGMKRGKSIVTANKDMISLHGRELFNTAGENGVDLLFEASVGGGIPIIRPLKYCLASNKIKEIIGIINGTTNYMLTKMTEEDDDFESVLKEAQEKGYAEADPTADVGGYDAARKLSILASIAFNTRVSFDDVYVEGITKIAREDIAYARDLNCLIKLLGIAKDTEEGIEARVHPCFIPVSHPLASVNDVYNAIFVRGDAVGDTMFFGRGAGDMPTGSAVAADIMEAARNKLRGITGINCTCYENKSMARIGRIQSRYYIRLKALDRPGVLASIAFALGRENVSIATMLQKHTDGNMAEIVLVTHKVLEENLQNAVKSIGELSSVGKISNIIRVEGD